MIPRFKGGRRIAATLLFLGLTGCVSSTWLGRQIVRPEAQHRVEKFERSLARPFYEQQVVLKVAAPDAGSINAAIIQPAYSDPEITVRYPLHGSSVFSELKFPELLPLSSTFVAYTHQLKRWLPSVKSMVPIGTLIMVPAYGFGKSSLLSWGLFFADRGWRVVMVDLRGQGTSTSPYLTWGMRDKHDLHRLVDLLKRRHLLVKPWFYFGVSYGAGVVLMAAAGPPTPDGVIAVAPWAKAENTIVRFGELVGGWMVPAARSPEWTKAEKVADRYAGIDLSRANPIQYVRQIHAPVLYLGGGSDPLATPAELRAMFRRTPHGTLRLDPGLSHVQVVADVPAFCPDIVRWLGQVQGHRQEACNVKTKTIHKNVREQSYQGLPGPFVKRRQTP